jgi:DNA polymerase
VSSRPAAERRADLLALYHELRDHRCPLAASRTNVVFGSGNANADLMFVGEAPGANEDRQGLPFVGNAGRLLDRLLGEIGLERRDAFIANVLKCRPPGNRDPLPEEIAECTPHLMRQIELIEPRVICTLGNFALKLLSGAKRGITKVHGEPQSHEIAGQAVTLYPLFHPSAALRTPAVLELLREDMARLPALLGGSGPEAPTPAAGASGGRGEPGRGEGKAASPGPSSGEADQLDLFG